MKKTLIILTLIALAVTSVTSIYFYKKYDVLITEIMKSRLENKTYINFEDAGLDQMIDIEGDTYISFDMFNKYISKNSYLSKSKSRIYIPTSDISVETDNSEVDRFISNSMKKFNLPVVTSGEKKFVKLDLISRVFDLKYVYYQKSNNRYLFTEDSIAKESYLTKKSNFYVDVSGNHISLETLKQGYSSYVDSLNLSEDGKYKSINSKGIMGFVDSEDILLSDIEFSKYELTKIDRSKELSFPFHLSWDQVSTYKKNMELDDVDNLPGVDILSPTWMSLNVDGIVLNIASLDYINNAHKNNKLVWALYSNSFNPSWTDDLLNSKEDMDDSISQILFYSHVYGFDGINIDFENMYLKNQDGFSEYVSYLSAWIKKAGMISSIDVTVPWGSDMWSKVYDREEISKSVDYIMLMAYDEHWASSQTAGSVASKDWTRKGVDESLKLIPKEKLVLGMPLYTRIWEETSSASSKITKSKVLSLKNVEKFIADNDLETRYDEITGQNYSEYTKDGKLYRIWFEDEDSILMRLGLRNEYKLPGVATWSLEFADENHFKYIDENLE